MLSVIVIGSINAEALDIKIFDLTSYVVSKNIGYVIVWGLYFKNSTRVKNTFIIRTNKLEAVES